MMLLVTFMMALREVRRNTMRSFLTMLGIVIGVGAVITMVTIGKGATRQVTESVGALGENVLMLRPGAQRRGGMRQGAKGFEAADVSAIENEVPGISAVAPTSSTQATIVFGNENVSTSVTGTTNQYLEVRGYSLGTGRLFSEAETAIGSPVCILGTTVEQNLFADADPIGERIRVGRVSCQVVGVLESKGAAAFGDQDDVVLMPMLAVQRRVAGEPNIDSINIKANEGQSLEVLQAQIEALMRERRGVQRGATDDFNVRNVQEIADAMSAVTTSLTSLLGGIAAVSLLVGGIGIMNIMLVSVTERTREIGTRLAIGALASEVLLQFLVEAVVLSTLGGIIGIGTGVGLSYGASRVLELPFVVAPEVMVGAFVFSAVVGIGFGYLPARKAAHLNPIEALRHE